MPLPLTPRQAQSCPTSASSTVWYPDPKTGKKALDASYVSAWGGTGSVFAIIGHQVNSFIADRYGRRPAFLLASTIAIAGILTEQFVTTMAGWLGGKMVTGLGWGMGQVVALTVGTAHSFPTDARAVHPEVAPVQLRGALCCYALFVALGQLSSAVALLIVNRTTPHEWRRAIYSGYVLVGIFLFSSLHRRVASVLRALDRHDDAKKALARLWQSARLRH
jgi:MFS family permease